MVKKINVKFIAPVLRHLYTDEMDIYREVEQESPVGDIEVVRTKIYENIECRADPWDRDDDPETQRYEENHQILPVLVFCATSIKVQKGDWLEIRRLDGSESLDLYQGYANASQVYPSHQEIKIEVKQPDV